MLYNATHKQLAHTRKIMRLRAYITPRMYFPAIPRSSPSAQKTHDDNFPHISTDPKKSERQTPGRNMRRPPGTTLQHLRAYRRRYVPITFAVIRNLCRENLGSNFAIFCASEKRKIGQKNWLYIGWFAVLLHTSGGQKRARIFVKKTS